MESNIGNRILLAIENSNKLTSMYNDKYSLNVNEAYDVVYVIKEIENILDNNKVNMAQTERLETKLEELKNILRGFNENGVHEFKADNRKLSNSQRVFKTEKARCVFSKTRIDLREHLFKIGLILIFLLISSWVFGKLDVESWSMSTLIVAVLVSSWYICELVYVTCDKLRYATGIIIKHNLELCDLILSNETLSRNDITVTITEANKVKSNSEFVNSLADLLTIRPTRFIGIDILRYMYIIDYLDAVVNYVFIDKPRDKVVIAHSLLERLELSGVPVDKELRYKLDSKSMLDKINAAAEIEVIYNSITND